MASEETKLALIEKQLGNIEKFIEHLPAELEKQFEKYVTQDQFTPTRMIAYGFASAILGGFALALVALLIRAPV